MTRDAAREQRWLWRGIATLVVLALALFALTTYSVVQTAQDRAAAADRADRTTHELRVLAESLDRQAAALEDQAEQLEQQAARAETSREQFRRAAREILDRLGSTVDAFDPSAPSALPPAAAEPVDEPSPRPSGPGCDARGNGPPRCRS